MNDDQAELEEFGMRWAEAELVRDLTHPPALAHEGGMHLSPIATPPGPPQQQG